MGAMEEKAGKSTSTQDFRNTVYHSVIGTGRLLNERWDCHSTLPPSALGKGEKKAVIVAQRKTATCQCAQ